MCGIAALYSPSGDLRAGVLQAMADAVHYRGPDDEGLACFRGPELAAATCGGPDTPPEAYGAALPYSPERAPARDGACLALSHRRLSILDLSAAGHQPMCTPDRSLWIVYNGEIYNYIELREELKALGHAFSTGCDTEVILAAYREWGRACLERLNGMFAFVLLDRPRRRLFAARDRFGVKPLYYWVSPRGVLALASEIKQFSALPGWRPRVNGQRAYDFLNWGVQDHTDETLYEGVFQLRGGEAVEIDLDASGVPQPGTRLAAYRWYGPRAVPFRGSLQQAADELRSLLTDAIRLRLRADVPVGSCLSGGLDSSSIVCLMNGLLREQGMQALQHVFSACASVSRFDERRYIEEVVGHTGVIPHYVYPSLDGLFRINDRITWHNDEPFGSTSIYAQWHVFRLGAEQGVKVMLDGQGADEQFAGYHSFFAPRFRALFLGLHWATLCAEMMSVRDRHGYGNGWVVAQLLNGLLPEPLRQPLRRLAGRPAVTAPWIDLERLGAVPRDPYLHAGSSRAGSVREMSLAQVLATSLPMLLHWEDRNSMAHSIEARVPFLDYRLVEFALGLPDEYKIRGGTTKVVLREGLRGLLPEAVRGRVDKLGFATPEETWLREENPALFRASLDEAIEASNGILRPAVKQLLERMIRGRDPFDYVVWRCISFASWLKVCKVAV